MFVLDKICDFIAEKNTNKLDSRFSEFLDGKEIKSIIQKLDEYVKNKFHNELYYNSLDKFIHNGNNDFKNIKGISSFYWSLLKAIFDSEPELCGENHFACYNWRKFKNFLPNPKNTKMKLKAVLVKYIECLVNRLVNCLMNLKNF